MLDLGLRPLCVTCGGRAGFGGGAGVQPHVVAMSTMCSRRALAAGIRGLTRGEISSAMASTVLVACVRCAVEDASGASRWRSA
jgi:hypothetical protein